MAKGQTTNTAFNYNRFALDMDSRYSRSFSGGNGNGSESGYKRYTRSRSRERSRDRNDYRRRNSRSRSRERSSHYRNDRSPDRDLYRDLIDEDYEDQGNYNSRQSLDHRQRHGEDKYDRWDADSQGRRDHDSYSNQDRHDQSNYDKRGQDRDKDRDHRWKNYDRLSRERNHDDFDRGSERSSRSNDQRQFNNNGNSNSSSSNRDREKEGDRDRRYSSDEDSDMASEFRQRGAPNSGSSVEPLNNIILFGLKKHVTEADIMGELIKVDMEPTSIRVMRKQQTGASRCFAFVEFKTVEEATRWMELTQGVLQLGDHRVTMQYSHTRISDWTCIKCGASNFKRRFQCYMCNASRAESENALHGDGEGIDEISRILTKKIMLRGLDALTNEEGVLTALQQRLPELAKTVSKVLVSRDVLTNASRGICYLNFDTLIDSMNVFNGLTALDPPLTLDDKTVIVTYCIDSEDRQMMPAEGNFFTAGETAMSPSAITAYTLADVPRLAEYSASVYASNPLEHAQYVQYYTDYYTTEISKNCGGRHVTEANSGAAVALSAIQRKQRKVSQMETMSSVTEAKVAFLARGESAPKGNDGKKYDTPDVSKYQYDETSGYYYDHVTGLYYDAHSQYYYNNETGAYLYWDQKRSTYVLATPASTQAALKEVLADAEKKEEEAKKAKEKEREKEETGKPDKVKVAKKIVKDMEKWAKHLNQKKDYTAVATPQPILSDTESATTSRASQGAYADVGFSILEKKDLGKLNEYVPEAGPPAMSKLVGAYGGPSDSDDDNSGNPKALADEADYVDFQKLTCRLCKRAFQSLDILQKHLKMSNLHKENMAKLKQNSAVEAGTDEGQSYRDRAKERRLKYGESDPPPPNRSRERFEQEIKTLQSRQKDSFGATPATPISSSNVGSRLMQKMGWSEGQGLGKKNQGRTEIIEADGRSNNVGLGNKTGQLTSGNDYKSYIKKMMKQRYENA
ncbi:RNA-binding protein 5 isoform X1 [Drosophila mauritiana]|uniref:RNA-binding protein 5 isoform X1 n=2 Tax=Drosophila mauritiana TaxID=7226 RepID=A0A6P8L7F6_DROMA|nr:RNA-binding protein 5 isoform X1 [Drosophila mauritiana]